MTAHSHVPGLHMIGNPVRPLRRIGMQGMALPKFVTYRPRAPEGPRCCQVETCQVNLETSSKYHLRYQIVSPLATWGIVLMLLNCQGYCCSPRQACKASIIAKWLLDNEKLLRKMQAPACCSGTGRPGFLVVLACLRNEARAVLCGTMNKLPQCGARS
jgi:hypothetical protein